MEVRVKMLMNYMEKSSKVIQQKNVYNIKILSTYINIHI